MTWWTFLEMSCPGPAYCGSNHWYTVVAKTDSKLILEYTDENYDKYSTYTHDSVGKVICLEDIENSEYYAMVTDEDPDEEDSPFYYSDIEFVSQQKLDTRNNETWVKNEDELGSWDYKNEETGEWLRVYKLQISKDTSDFYDLIPELVQYRDPIIYYIIYKHRTNIKEGLTLLGTTLSKQLAKEYKEKDDNEELKQQYGYIKLSSDHKFIIQEYEYINDKYYINDVWTTNNIQINPKHSINPISNNDTPIFDLDEEKNEYFRNVYIEYYLSDDDNAISLPHIDSYKLYSTIQDIPFDRPFLISLTDETVSSCSF